jgi:hypothetical protein
MRYTRVTPPDTAVDGALAPHPAIFAESAVRHGCRAVFTIRILHFGVMIAQGALPQSRHRRDG